MVEQFKKFITKDIAVAVLFLLIGMGIYANALNAPFIWDDFTLIDSNEQIRSFDHIGEWFTTSSTSGVKGGHDSDLYRPMMKALDAVIYHFFELKPFAYRVLNILLHIINSFLIFTLFRKLNLKKIGAIFAALIFLVHPVMTEAVTYISGLPDVLSGFFILIGLLCFKSNKNILSLAALLLAFLSKEIAITFFAFAWLMTIYEWKTLDKKTLNTKLKWLTAFTVISIIYFILKLTVLNFTGTADLTSAVNEYTESTWIRTITFISIIWEYIKLIVYPAHLFFDKSVSHVTTLFTPRGVFGLTVIIGGCLAAYNSFLGNKKFFFGFAWFFIPLIPVSGIFIISNAFYAERWLYLPLIGVVFGIAALWEKLKTKEAKTMYICVLIILSMAFSVRTIFRNAEWADPQVFFENEIENNPYSPRVYNQLGTVHFSKGNYNRALQAIKKSVELDDIKSSPIFRFNLGNTYYYLNKNDEAIFWLNEALKIKPDYEKAQIVLDKILKEKEIYQ